MSIQWSKTCWIEFQYQKTKENTIKTKIYDFFLSKYCYLEVSFYQFLAEAEDFRKNINWIRLYGPYKGSDGSK